MIGQIAKLKGDWWKSLTPVNYGKRLTPVSTSHYNIDSSP